MADGDGETAAAHGSFLDLLGEEPAAAASTSSPGEISFGGSPDVAQHRQQQPECASDPFAAFDFAFVAAEPAAADACSSQQQHQQQQQEHSKLVHHQQQQQGEAGPSDSLPKGDQAAAHPTGGDSVGQDGAAPAERASRLAHILQQHSQNQGQSTAKIRLHLATVAAKQVTVRKMLAELAGEVGTAAAAADSSSEQHLQQLTSRLQATAVQLAAAQEELAARRHEAAQEAEQHGAEVASLRAQLQQLQDGEAVYQAEIQGLQERLLEAGEQLSRLTGELPGALRGVAASPDGGGAGGSSGGGNKAPASGSSGGGSSGPGSEAAPAGEAGAAGGSGGGDGALPVTPVAAGRGAKSGRSGSMLTPDQSAAAQLKSWLHESQAALMEAQEELMAREAEVRQLQAQLKQQQQSAGVPEQPGAPAAAGGDGAEPQQHELAELQAVMMAAETAAATATAEREQLSAELGSLRQELQQLKSQLAAADDSRADAVAAYESLKQQAAAAATQQQQQQTQPAEEAAAAAERAAAAAAERAAAAEAELQAALAAAAEASNEVAALHEQLKQLQQQQQTASPDAVTAGSELAGPATPTVGSSTGASSLEQLQAESHVQALQTELADTRQRLLLLLRLVRTAAAAAGPGGSKTEQPALSDQERGQLQRLLAEGAEACGDLDGSGSSKLELGALAQLLQGLQWRYACQPQQLQAAILRGREMQALLQAALAHVHALKSEAGGGSCACPSTADYAQLQPPQPWEQQAQPSAAAGQQQQYHEQQYHEQQQPFMEQPPTSSNGSGWLAGPDVAAAEAAAAAAVDAAAAGGWTDDWHTLPPSVSAGAAAAATGGGGSCSTDALRQCGAAGAGLPADEGLGYDGLDGAWWASSTVEPVGELPEFLLKK